jgi:mRNA-degrading endonuclease RelE of RelBE toxin-antitoxin system
VEFIEAPAFTRHLAAYLDDEGYRRFQAFLIANSEAGTVIPHSGGFRKVRWQEQRRKKGKRGGLRIIYYLFPEDAQIWLVTLYDKEQKDDLTPAEKRALHRAITGEKAARAARKPRT